MTAVPGNHRYRRRVQAHQGSSLKQIVVLGRGRVGQSLSDALKAPLWAGHETKPVPEGSLCVLAVADSAIAETAARLRGTPAAVVHVSGSRGLEVLQTARDRGIKVGVFHPLQAFPKPRPAAAFKGIMFGIDASDPALLTELEFLAKKLGGSPRRVEGESKRLRYHAASTMAGPLMIGLLSQAAEVFTTIGLTRDESIGALLPLIKGTIANLESMRLPNALIGPVRRGDAATVKLHLDCLNGQPRDIYRTLTLACLDLAVEAGVDAPSSEAIRALLQT